MPREPSESTRDPSEGISDPFLYPKDLLGGSGGVTEEPRGVPGALRVVVGVLGGVSKTLRGFPEALRRVPGTTRGFPQDRTWRDQKITQIRHWTFSWT